MIEVKDEILEGEPLYRIRDKDGNILFDNVTLEMITEVLQSGTPLNKTLFDSIKNYIDNLIPNNYVIGTVTPSSESSLTISCGFKPQVVILVPYNIVTLPTAYGIVLVGDKGFSVLSSNEIDKVSATLSDSGCTISSSFKVASTYRYIAIKG